MAEKLIGAIVLLAAMIHASTAQRDLSEEGFELGNFRFRPVAEAAGVYDNRVQITDNGDAEGDFYSEVAAALFLENRPALFDISGDAGYGYRFYRDYATVLNNDFYQAGLAIATSDRPLTVGAASYLKKTLDYDTLYGPSPGQEPGAILTRDPSTRYTATANVAYEKMLTDKTSIQPGYDYTYYFQDFTDRDEAEWQIHRAALRFGYGYSGKTRAFLTGYYSLQTREEEDGTIGAVTVGAEGEVSEKTSWQAHVGIGAADYELSGTDQGFVGLLRGNWLITEKLSAYIYGRTNFQPGYSGGGARRVYRLGYGGVWRMYARWSVRAQILHDYDEPLGDADTDENEVRNFFSLRTEYYLMRRLVVGGDVRFVMDEEEVDQTVVGLSAIYRY